MTEGYTKEIRDGRVYFVEKGFAFDDHAHVWREKKDAKTEKMYYVRQGGGERKWRLPALSEENDKKGKKNKRDDKKKRDRSTRGNEDREKKKNRKKDELGRRSSKDLFAAFIVPQDTPDAETEDENDVKSEANNSERHKSPYLNETGKNQGVHVPNPQTLLDVTQTTPTRVPPNSNFNDTSPDEPNSMDKNDVQHSINDHDKGAMSNFNLSLQEQQGDDPKDDNMHMTPRLDDAKPPLVCTFAEPTKKLIEGDREAPEHVPGVLSKSDTPQPLHAAETAKPSVCVSHTPTPATLLENEDILNFSTDLIDITSTWQPPILADFDPTPQQILLDSSKCPHIHINTDDRSSTNTSACPSETDIIRIEELSNNNNNNDKNKNDNGSNSKNENDFEPHDENSIRTFIHDTNHGASNWLIDNASEGILIDYGMRQIVPKREQDNQEQYNSQSEKHVRFPSELEDMRETALLHQNHVPSFPVANDFLPKTSQAMFPCSYGTVTRTHSDEFSLVDTANVPYRRPMSLTPELQELLDTSRKQQQRIPSAPPRDETSRSSPPIITHETMRDALQLIKRQASTTSTAKAQAKTKKAIQESSPSSFSQTKSSIPRPTRNHPTWRQSPSKKAKSKHAVSSSDEKCPSQRPREQRTPGATSMTEKVTIERTRTPVSKTVRRPYTESYSYVLRREERRRKLMAETENEGGREGSDGKRSGGGKREVSGERRSESYPVSFIDIPRVARSPRRQETPSKSPSPLSSSPNIKQANTNAVPNSNWEITIGNTVNPITATTPVRPSGEVDPTPLLDPPRQTPFFAASSTFVRKKPSSSAVAYSARRWSENPVYDIAGHAPSAHASTRAPSVASSTLPPSLIVEDHRGKGKNDKFLSVKNYHRKTEDFKEMEKMRGKEKLDKKKKEEEEEEEEEVRRYQTQEHKEQLEVRRQVLPEPSSLDEPFHGAVCRLSDWKQGESEKIEEPSSGPLRHRVPSLSSPHHDIRNSDQNASHNPPFHHERTVQHHHVCSPKNNIAREPSMTRAEHVSAVFGRFCVSPTQRETNLRRWLRPEENAMRSSLLERQAQIRLRVAELTNSINKWDKQHLERTPEFHRNLELVHVKKQLSQQEWERMQAICWEHFSMELLRDSLNPIKMVMQMP